MDGPIFVDSHAFKYLEEEDLSLNGVGIFFWVKPFESSEMFQLQKPYQYRLEWRARSEQSSSGTQWRSAIIVAPQPSRGTKRDPESARRGAKAVSRAIWQRSNAAS